MNAVTLPNWRPLKALLGGLAEVPERLEVSDITQDSRSVTPGAAFLACRGRTHHGLDFAAEVALDLGDGDQDGEAESER